MIQHFEPRKPGPTFVQQHVTTEGDAVDAADAADQVAAKAVMASALAGVPDRVQQAVANAIPPAQWPAEATDDPYGPVSVLVHRILGATYRAVTVDVGCAAHTDRPRVDAGCTACTRLSPDAAAALIALLTAEVATLRASTQAARRVAEGLAGVPSSRPAARAGMSAAEVAALTFPATCAYCTDTLPDLIHMFSHMRNRHPA